MRHEPSGPWPSLQPISDRRCPSCRAVKPLDDFPIGAGAPASCLLRITGNSPDSITEIPYP